MDHLGHVNNTFYFNYCETARMSYFEIVRMDDHRAGGRFGPALVSTQLNFRRQVSFPADLEIATRVSEIGRSSFRMEYTITFREGGPAVAEGFAVVAWVDYEINRAVPLPEGLTGAIRRFEGME